MVIASHLHRALPVASATLRNENASIKRRIVQTPRPSYNIMSCSKVHTDLMIICFGRMTRQKLFLIQLSEMLKWTLPRCLFLLDFVSLEAFEAVEFENASRTSTLKTTLAKRNYNASKLASAITGEWLIWLMSSRGDDFWFSHEISALLVSDTMDRWRPTLPNHWFPLSSPIPESRLGFFGCLK